MKKVGLISGIVITVLLLAFGAYYFLYLNKSDDKLLDDYNKKINSMETSLSDDETVDQDVIEEIDEDTTEDDKSLDNLESSLNSILNNLENIENAEAEISEVAE